MSGGQQSKRARRRNKQLVWAKKGGGWNRAIRPRPNCPTPAKRAFTDEAQATKNAGGKGSVYRCRCGSWHRTRHEETT